MAAHSDHPDHALAEDLKQLDAEDGRSIERLTELEILDYLDGRLDEAAAADVRERLSLNPEASALLLDLAEPDGLPEPPPSEVPPWEQVHGALVDRGVLTDRVEAVARPTGVSPLWRWAAILLLATTLGLGGLTISRQPEHQPSARVEHWVLQAEGEGPSRDRTGTTRIVRGDADWWVLILTAGDLGGANRIEVAVLDAEDQRLEVLPARRNPTGTFDVALPAGSLAAGTYFLELSGVIDGRRQLLERYSFDVQ